MRLATIWSAFLFSMFLIGAIGPLLSFTNRELWCATGGAFIIASLLSIFGTERVPQHPTPSP